MASKGCVTLAEAQRQKLVEDADLQDSQLITMHMHRIHGVGDRSSSPLQPLDDWNEIHSYPRLQQSGLLQVKQSLNGRCISTPILPPPPPPSARSNSRSAAISSESNKQPRGRSTTDQNPAISTTTRGRDQLSPAGSANRNRSPSRARAPDASNHGRASSRRSSSHSTPSPSRLPIVGNQVEAGGTVSNPPHPPAATDTVNSAHPIPRNEDNDDDHNGRECKPPTNQSTIASLSPTYSKHRRRKMESSQSPTQSNEGRSYDQYLPRGDDLLPSDPYELDRLPQSQRSLPVPASDDAIHDDNNEDYDDDDTGAVNFDFSALGRQDTQVSHPDPITIDNLRGTSPTQLIGNPETPAPSKNPFTDGRSSLMAASQLFRQTQFSSAYKTFSPTSSRPSPDNLHPLNSISPNPNTSSPLKAFAMETSPLKGAPSSLPNFPLGYDTSPRQDDEGPVRLHSTVNRKNMSASFHPTTRLPGEPFGLHNKLTNKSQENNESPAKSSSDVESDEDLSDEENRRRQRVMLKKASAARRLRAITFERVSNSDEVVPSTNNEKSPSPEAQEYLDQCVGNSARDSQNAIEDTQEGVLDSQGGTVQLSASLFQQEEFQPRGINNTSSNDAVVPNTASSPTISAPAPGPVLTSTPAPNSHLIPESSPTNPGFLALEEMIPQSEEISTPEPLSNLSVEEKEGPQTPKVFPAAKLDSGVVNSPSTSQIAVVETSPPVRSSPPPPAFSTRARLRKGHGQSPVTAAPTSSTHPVTSTSPLSRLGTTPELSDRTTPLSDELPRPDITPSLIDGSSSSPAVAKANRHKISDAASKPNTGRTNSLRASTRRSRRSVIYDDSADELAMSPLVSIQPPLEQSTRLSRLGRTSIREPPALRESNHGIKLFSGMMFAISFQSKQQGEKDSHYKSRMTTSSEITTKIKQGGGKVLANGFDQLFETSPVKNADREAISTSSTPEPDDDIKLTSSAKDIGFAALIADGHSRKVKYMQALALGLPCIHTRWITTCIEKQKLVDWSAYLLCAGNSSFLGDAIKSRILPSYDAATAKLSDIIQHRPRLLDQSRIILVMSRADEQKKMAYVFLARVLGASLSRVYTIDEARKQLKAREDAGNPFDWVYVDEKMTGGADLFSSSISISTTSTAGGKKRKRKSELSTAGPPPKKIRGLSDELVIQSLILGRMMEDGEVSG